MFNMIASWPWCLFCSGLFICVWASWISTIHFFSSGGAVPTAWILMIVSAKCSIWLTVYSENKWEHISGGNEHKAETSMAAAESGLVLQPGHHLEMWMDSLACAVIGAKNTPHTPVCTLSSWHVLCGTFIITLRNDRLSMNGCWRLEVVLYFVTVVDSVTQGC